MSKTDLLAYRLQNGSSFFHMSPKRVFLGWARPLCETVPACLLANAKPGLMDLRGTVVVVPTRQAGWRLRTALALAADARGVALLGPEIVTPRVLLQPPAGRRLATPTQCLAAWVAVLRDAASADYPAFLGGRGAAPLGVARALEVAQSLEKLRGTLIDGGLRIASVMARNPEGEEQARWADMAALEAAFAATLSAWGLVEPQAATLDAAEQGTLPLDARRVVVAAVPDPPVLFMDRLARWMQAGGRVECLVAAPPDEAEAFDAWGRPRPDAWTARPIPLRNEQIRLEGTPEDQARRIATALAEVPAADWADAGRRPNLALGVPDREVVAPLQRELAALGLSTFDPQDRPFAFTRLYRLIEGLLGLRARAGYDEVAALLRHPDVMAMLGGGRPELRALDAHQAEYLPVTLADMSNAPEPLAGALERVRAWHAALTAGRLPAALRAVLAEIYAGRSLREDDPADSAFRQAAAVLDDVLRELDEDGMADASVCDAAASELLQARLGDATLRGERRGERLDLEGWLELAWNPAPVLFVAGMNEGFVPDGRVGDLFLPDSLRTKLGLRDDRMRAARDAYLLTALLEQRREAGRVILLLGKTSNAGDPLRPSRLLFRCADEELPARARCLFAEPPARSGAEAFRVSFALDPALVPSACINPRRKNRLSPTSFRAYLACPLRFYLGEVLGMETSDDRAREPDVLAFGTLVHAVLEEMASDRKRWACRNPGALADWLEQAVRAKFRERFGERPWLGVQLAVDSAVVRLRAFAQAQADWYAAGWRIVKSEQTLECTLDGMTIRGQVDRVDRHEQTGEYCVLDYKTSDRLSPPDRIHLGSPLADDPLPEAAVPAELLPPRSRAKRWADLQLPLYRELVRPVCGADARLGYVCLPNAVGSVGFQSWETYTDALHACALACARAVIAKIRAGIFWPPGNPHYDDYDSLLLGEPEKTMVRPPAPWSDAG